MEDLCPVCKLMIEAMTFRHTCCLNCRFSYFRPLEEDGMCWNQAHVHGIQPKLVQEFMLCPLWQGK